MTPPSNYFRGRLTYETAEPALRWMNHRILVGAAMRTPASVTYDQYVLD